MEAAEQLQPVTAEAIAAILRDEDLEYALEEAGVRTGFVNAAIVITVDGPHLVFEALWRGVVPKELASHLLFAVNEHNQTHFAPTLRMFEGEQETLAASAIRTMNVEHGASFNQLGSFIVSSIGTTLEAFAFLEQTFPTLVNWEDPNNE